MGQKVNPVSLRIGGIKTWKSRWFLDNKRKYREQFIEDIRLRDFITKKLKNAAISRIEIERSRGAIKFIIFTSRPGIIIGRGGTGIEDLRKELQRRIASKGVKIDIEVNEVKDPEADAAIVAHLMAEQIQKRISFRRVMKRAIDRSMQSKNVKGIKVMLSGRLDGSEMSRREWLSEGKMPLHNLRADIDFGQTVAYTTYGVIGIKVWIYKGEVFNK